MPKQRVINALHYKQSDMVPMMELEFQIYQEYCGRMPILGYEYGKLSPKEKESALHTNAEIMIECAEMAGHDAIKDFAGYWEVQPGEPALLWLPTLEDRVNQIKAIKSIAGEEYFVIGSIGATMGIPSGPNLYDFVYALYENPDDMKNYCESLLNQAIETQKVFAEAGADAIINCSDVAFNTGTFISPEMMEEFFYPYLYRWVHSVKDIGLYSIWHTDGNILNIMDKVIDSKVNAIQCVDPCAGMNIVSLKEKYDHQLCLIGNVNCSILQTGTPDEIDKEVKSIVTGCNKGGGFILSGCNVIFKGISAENYQIMVDARRKYGTNAH